MLKSSKINHIAIDKSTRLGYNTSMKNKTKDTKHVRINDIDFNYFMGCKMLMVSYPNGTDETFHSLTAEQANNKVGSILENN
tara:strand:- start:177 stop:422 length:246 start_codon:yes stop_codon:yes gene_type:complete